MAQDYLGGLFDFGGGRQKKYIGGFEYEDQGGDMGFVRTGRETPDQLRALGMEDRGGDMGWVQGQQTPAQMEARGFEDRGGDMGWVQSGRDSGPASAGSSGQAQLESLAARSIAKKEEAEKNRLAAKEAAADKAHQDALAASAAESARLAAAAEKSRVTSKERSLLDTETKDNTPDIIKAGSSADSDIGGSEDDLKKRKVGGLSTSLGLKL